MCISITTDQMVVSLPDLVANIHCLTYLPIAITLLLTITGCIELKERVGALKERVDALLPSHSSYRSQAAST
jgi:hypothetical protein